MAERREPALDGVAARDRRRGALDGLTLPACVRELPFVAQVDVRADADSVAAAGAAIGVALPVEPNTLSMGGGRAALWLGPDEWLVLGADGDEAAIVRALEGAEGWITAVDVSANRTVLELAGPRAREVLMKGCSLDAHPRAFGPGQCVQTALARTQVILGAVAEDTYRIFVRRSFAAYLAAWLLDATAEYAALTGARAPAGASARSARPR